LNFELRTSNVELRALIARRIGVEGRGWLRKTSVAKIRVNQTESNRIKLDQTVG
jgi:hypothetical protein